MAFAGETTLVGISNLSSTIWWKKFFWVNEMVNFGSALSTPYFPSGRPFDLDRRGSNVGKLTFRWPPVHGPPRWTTKMDYLDGLSNGLPRWTTYMDYLINYPEKKIERNITPWLFVLIDSPRSAILFSFRVYYRCSAVLQAQSFTWWPACQFFFQKTLATCSCESTFKDGESWDFSNKLGAYLLQRHQRRGRQARNRLQI